MDGINLKQIKPSVNNPRSNFDLSFKRLFTTRFGNLFPNLVLPIMPGDKISVSTEHIMRMAPFVSQCFQHYVIAYHYYFVPNRLIWPEFDVFMQDGWDGQTPIPHPVLELNPMVNNGNSNWDYDNLLCAMDVPLAFIHNADSTIEESNSYPHKLNALPFGAYARVYLDYFLGTDTPCNKLLQQVMSDQRILTNGSNTVRLTELFARIRSGNPDLEVNFFNADIAKFWQLLDCLYPLDYFTSGRSNPQLGPVMTIPVNLISTDSAGTSTFELDHTPSSSGSVGLSMFYTSGSNTIELGTGQGSRVTINGKIFQNTASIYDFYSAARLTELFAIYGYTGFTPSDALAAEFGVKNSDARLHRSEHLYSDYFDFNCGEVFSNDLTYEKSGLTESQSLVPGAATAIGKQDGRSKGFYHEFSEFGYLLGLVCVYPEASYFQGLPRHFQMFDRFDYPHPKLSNLCMEEIRVSEVYCNPHDDLHDNDVLCYLPPYSHYKMGINRLNAQISTNLEYMNAGRKFSQIPHFNDSFLRVIPHMNDLNRTFNVTTNYPEDKPIAFDIMHHIHANRELPKFGLFNI